MAASAARSFRKLFRRQNLPALMEFTRHVMRHPLPRSMLFFEGHDPQVLRQLIPLKRSPSTCLD